MNDSVRDRILNRLQTALTMPTFREADTVKTMSIPRLNRAEKLRQLKTHMEAVRTEVYVVTQSTWMKKLEAIAAEKKMSNLLIAPETAYGKALESAWSGRHEGLPGLVAYGENIEAFKTELFEVDAALTTTIGAIADPGVIILWPTEKEPRSMSLVPHIHLALLEADNIYTSPAEAFSKLKWSENVPANALFISGPSKTADIEFILTFGVHGPKELVLLIIDE